MTLLIDFIIHIDQHLLFLVQNYHSWIYLILAVIIFAETGLVVTPFLPGDSLIFAAAGLCALGDMNIGALMLLMLAAAVAGDAVNFAVGKYYGRQLFANPASRLFKQKYLTQTENFYRRHGGKTIIIARFMPIIRTFAPFVAGMGKMGYRRFSVYNILGAGMWIGIFSLLGYYFGNLAVVKNNLSLVLVAIIIISLLPMIIIALKNKYSAAHE